ncbi:hypothetical protein TWF102_007349 [Orbilia oligospora]|uniref:Uncharacterized protein n=1 Tax=Orbilia oligospora TaxID=2813651 RepID=A0A7C8J5D2_ORBOL|nr:hypothetical protein TWF103_001327 [Orbilia oligospora]KAF3095300.1 hypothetical protein TWF102_007349 [Orbilia oligospora]KAF3121324.1 hypothetical protein TWF594_003224 [Orbilia oligospora]
MTAEYYFGHSHMPLWQFIGLLIIFSILIGSPAFVCFVYHRRKERDRLQDVNRRALAQKHRPEFVIDGRDYYLLPFPHKDIKRRPSTSRGETPRQESSGGSTVPLLVLNGRTTEGSGSASPVMGRIHRPSNLGFDGASMAVSMEQEAVLNANFAERTGTVTSVAYPQTAHRGSRSDSRGRGGTGNYGTLGNMMHSTYTAAQRAYRGRHRLNFWSGLMQQVPWVKDRGGRLEAIDEESVGSSRFLRGDNQKGGNKRTTATTTAITTSGASSNVDVNIMTARGSVYRGVIVGQSTGTLNTESSAYTMSRGTPPTFEKVNSREPYNPNMARSLTRRLLKFGFDQVRDGVGNPERSERGGEYERGEEDEEDGKGRQISGVWKKGVELKKRALERKKLETGNRLFSFQKKKVGDDWGDEEDEGQEGGDSHAEEGGTSPDDLAKTSIRDFAHAFKKDIVGSSNDYEEFSPTGTVRIHHIDDDDDDAGEDQQSTILTEDKEAIISSLTSPEATSPPPSSSSSPTFDDVAVDSSPITNENVPTITINTTSSSTTTQIEISTPTMGTLRGRKTLRDKSSVPGTQKMRMARNTPKNTLGRSSLQAPNSFESLPGEDTTDRAVGIKVDIEVTDGGEIIMLAEDSTKDLGKNA